jgi:hypothetical protein
MKFLVDYKFTSSTGFVVNGTAKIKAKNKELARNIFQKQNRDCVIKQIRR